MTRHFPKPTSSTIRGKMQVQVLVASKEVVPNPKVTPPSSKSTLFKRVTRSQSNELFLKPEAFSVGFKEQKRPRKKRMRFQEELAPGSQSNHSEPVTVRDEAKRKGERIPGSPSFSSPSPQERKEGEQVEQEHKDKKTFPKSAIIHEIQSDDEADEVPICLKKKPDGVVKKEKMKQETYTQM